MEWIRLDCTNKKKAGPKALPSPRSPLNCAAKRPFGGDIPETALVQLRSLQPDQFSLHECPESFAPTGSRLGTSEPRASTSRLVLRRVRIRRGSGIGLIAKPKRGSSPKLHRTRLPGQPSLSRFRWGSFERWTERRIGEALPKPSRQRTALDLPCPAAGETILPKESACDSHASRLA